MGILISSRLLGLQHLNFRTRHKTYLLKAGLACGPRRGTSPLRTDRSAQLCSYLEAFGTQGTIFQSEDCACAVDPTLEQPATCVTSPGGHALQPDPTRCRLPAQGASGAPTAIKEQSKHLLFLDFTASHNLGITYGDILNFTPLPATCSQYLATGLASSCIHHLPPAHMVATNLPMLLLGLECALFLLPPLPNTRLSSAAQILPLPRSFPAMISKLQ